MKVFVSSTIYDLTDCRAELCAYLKELGFEPYLSESEVGRFLVGDYENTIETCLTNLRHSDICIVLLNQRYGGVLDSYDGVSATHVELREALELSKRAENVKSGFKLLLFARDKLLGDYGLWKKNKERVQEEYLWISSEEDKMIFPMIQEYERSFPEGAPGWIEPFKSSVDLRNLITARLSAESGPIRLKKLLDSGHGPMWSLHAVNPKTTSIGIRLSVSIENIGRDPAINFSFRTIPDASNKNYFSSPCLKPFFPQSRVLDFNFSEISPLATGDPEIVLFKFLFEYESYNGIRIQDVFESLVTIHGEKMDDIKLVRRNFAGNSQIEIGSAEGLE